MASLHPDRDTLASFMRGDLPVGENRKVVRHLISGCSRCRKIAAALSPFDAHTGGNIEYGDAIQRVLEAVAAHEASLEAQRAVAPALLAELEQHPLPRQLMLVRNSRRFRCWPLCELAIERAFDYGFRSPDKAVAFATLAVTVAEELEDVSGVSMRVLNDLRGRAWAFLGNAQRIIGSDLEQAEASFRLAEEYLERGTGDPLEEAEVLSLKSYLRSVQLRFDEAQELLDQAATIYRRAGDIHKLGSRLIDKGTAFGSAGAPEKAVELIRQGAELIDRNLEPRRFLAAQHNLVLFLNECGRVPEAVSTLQEIWPLYAELGDQMNLLRLRWLEGQLARSQDHLDEAEAAFSEVKQAFVERGMAYDVALASLDLATVYSRRGRTREVKELAAEMLTIFRSLRVHREAIAALLIFQKAAETERVTLRLIGELADFLDRSRHDPKHRFQSSSP